MDRYSRRDVSHCSVQIRLDLNGSHGRFRQITTPISERWLSLSCSSKFTQVGNSLSFSDSLRFIQVPFSNINPWHMSGSLTWFPAVALNLTPRNASVLENFALFALLESFHKFIKLSFSFVVIINRRNFVPSNLLRISFLLLWRRR